TTGARDVHDASHTTIARAIATHYQQAGIRRCFGVIGSTNFEITRGLVDHGVEFVAARHETNAVVMAQAWTQATGEISVVSLHTGPGLTNGLTGIGEAAKSRTPMVVLVGDVARGAVESPFFMDQATVVQSVGAEAQRLHGPRTALQDAARALELARRERRTVVLSLPLDIQGMPEDQARPVAGRPLRDLPPLEPAAEDVEVLADLLAGAERPVVLAGLGAVLADARDDLIALADRSGALLATTARAHGLFAGQPWSVGISGGFSSPAASELLQEADVVLGFGATYTKFTTRFGRMFAKARHVVQIDADRARVGWNPTVDQSVVADARLTARRVTEALEGRGVRATGFRTPDTADRMERGANNRHAYEDGSTDHELDPRTLTKALDELLPMERTVAIDGGHFSGWPVRHLRVPDVHGWVFVQSFQSIGLGLATAIGASLANPHRLTVVGVGDGGFLMSIPDLETAVRLDRSMLIIVYNDSAYAAEVHHFAPMGMDTDIVEFPEVDFAAMGRGFGTRGAVARRVDDLDAVRDWVAEGAPGVFVLDARVTRDVVADWLAEALRVEQG
ncbi:thiamine pyrophosphate-binding protein, partial [Egicoccus sp. AB-alg2]|uniref:thiamine pyrophosphate-binding protein n=1 Tax=Egicoccus sp. AB-alg2 TaxID=3242693 RepID=UPI00359D998B